MTVNLTPDDWRWVLIALRHTGAAYAQVAVRQALAAADASRYHHTTLAKERQAESDEHAANAEDVLAVAAKIQEAL